MSILFLAQGSPAGKEAAEFAIALAQRFQTEITAQFVIDPADIFHLESFDGRAGLCGTGVFIEAEQEIERSLERMGESLLMAFAAAAEGDGVRVREFIQTGNRIQQVSWMAAGAWLLVLAGGEENLALARAVSSNVAAVILIVESSTEVILMLPNRFHQEFSERLVAHLEDMQLKIHTLSMSPIPSL